MNKQKKKTEKTKFSKLRLRSTQTNLTKKSISPDIREKISSYFSSLSDNSEDLSISNTEPYSDKIQLEITKINDEDDFKTQSKLKKFEIKIQKETKTTNKRTSNRKGMERYFENIQNQPSCSDTNPEHLQLALAMSKSIEDLENPGKNQDETEFLSTQEKLSNIKSTLEQFGFKTNRTTAGISSFKSNVAVRKQKKKIKFYTPTLFLRTEEDRAKLIENKVSQIITNISIYNKNFEENTIKNDFVDNKPRSFVLRDFYDEDSTLFRKNQLDLLEMKDEMFYNQILDVEVVKTGILLKDWGSIPGRDKSPPPCEICSETQLNLHKNQASKEEVLENRSPELFSENEENKNAGESDDSEVESLSLLDNISPRKDKSPRKSQKFVESSRRKNLFVDKTNSISLLDNKTALLEETNEKTEEKEVKNSQICHYESFFDNSNDIFDLTQTSEESKDNLECNKQKLEENDNFSVATQILNKKNEIFVDLTQSSEESKENKEETNKIQDDLSFFQLSSPLKLSIEDKNEQNVDKNLTPKQIQFDFDEFLKKIKKSSEKNVENKKVLKRSFSENINNCFELFSPKKCTEKSKKNEFISDSDENFDSTPKTTQNFSKIKNKTKNSTKKSFSVNFLQITDDLNKSDSSLSENDVNFNSTPKTVENFAKNKTKNGRNKRSKSIRKSFSENLSKLSKKQTDISSSDENLETTPKFSFTKHKNRCSTLKKSFSENFSSVLNHLPNKSPNFDDYSQSSDEINISDEELNYSMNKSNKIGKKSESLSQSSVCSDLSDDELNYSSKSLNICEKLEENDKNLIDFGANLNLNDLPYNGYEPPTLNNDLPEVIKHPRVTDLCTPSTLKKSSFEPLISSDDSLDGILKQNLGKFTPEGRNNEVGTPNSEVFIKTTNITPMPEFSDMDTPERNSELDKFGLKPMKRTKGVKILRYIYESTHPVSKNPEIKYKTSSDDEDNRIIKRRRKSLSIPAEKHEKLSKNEIAESEKLEDMIFERKQSNKILSCRIPLHIVWHNYLSNQHELQEKILLYQPLHVEEIYAELKNYGFKFHINDLIAFLDKKCITFRFTQNNRRRK